ncbi:hypothetical protein ACFYPZ_24645 [Streptomyces sp. NPDC005506]|uniref:hypothetical protein n=1 Tax=Streptomyces sp. NPDC005506 TaxID=3364718 RepID=UPI00368EB043
MTETTTCAVCDQTSELNTCIACRNRIAGLLKQLPEQYCYLAMSRQREQTGSDGRSSTRLHAPLPGREDTLNLLGPWARQNVSDAEDQVGPVPVLAVLETWCQVVTEERRLTPVRVHVSTMVTLLTRHLPWICEQGFVKEFFEEIRELLRTTQKITMTEPRKELLRGVTCPSCEGLTLVRYFPGDWAAECVLCSAVRLDQHDYNLLVQSQALVSAAATAVMPQEV